MIIWLSVVLPFLIAGGVYAVFRHRITWWELAIQLVVPIAMTGITKISVEHSQVACTEYWGHYIASAAYYERWNEKVSCRHPHMVRKTGYRTVTDSNGKSHRESYTYYEQEGWEHPYDVDDHDPYWEGYLSTGGSVRLSQSGFEQLAVQFGNRSFVNLNRHYFTINGNKYVTDWKREWEKVEPVTTAHTYENRVQASRSVFKFADVNPADFGLYPHPKIVDYYQRSVLGNFGSNCILEDKKFDFLNATLGSPRQVRLYVLVFKDKPIQAAMDQEAYWKGGNKNEFVTCIGVNEAKEVQWCHVFSWTEVDILKIEARSFIMDQKALDLIAYGDWLSTAIQEKWRRKNFEEFNYLTVDPPAKAVIWTFAMTLLVSVALATWSVFNSQDSENPDIMWVDILRNLFKKKGPL